MQKRQHRERRRRLCPWTQPGPPRCLTSVVSLAAVLSSFFLSSSSCSSSLMLSSSTLGQKSPSK